MNCATDGESENILTICCAVFSFAMAFIRLFEGIFQQQIDASCLYVKSIQNWLKKYWSDCIRFSEHFVVINHLKKKKKNHLNQ